MSSFRMWEASYRLIQTINYWPEGTVFVSVVDPGVGSDRKSVVVKTNSGRYIVTPDNGTLTHVIRLEGIAAVREIDEEINRLPRSGESYTFHGRDVYAFASSILIPLILSSVERIETISNAMELRGFGKGVKRTWYSGRKFSKMDIISIILCTALMIVSFLITFLNGSRYFNPFI